MGITLNSSIILTKNMERAIRFYREVLGLELQKQFETVAFFQDGLVIHDEAVYLNYIGGSDPSAAGFKAVYYYIASDIDETARLLQEKNVEFIHRVEEQSWGERVIRFCDPDGNVIEIGDGKNSG
jgi:catechol 2,3-dioxygenase-like lactoylglutathione lyase family enzyme